MTSTREESGARLITLPARVAGSTAGISAGIAASRIGLGLVVAKLGTTVLRTPPIDLPGFPQVSTVVQSLVGWDGAFYQRIAGSGYPANDPVRASFFPLYPLLVRIVHVVTTLSVPDAALLVTWISLWLAVWGTIVFVRTIRPASPRAVTAGIILVCTPASVFLMAGYPEATAIALTAWCLTWLARGRPLEASLLAALASATRPEGWLLAIAVGWSLLRTSWFRALAYSALSVAGLAAFSLFCLVRYHNPLEYVAVQKLWNRHATWPFHPVEWSLRHILSGTPVGPSQIASNSVAVFLIDDAVIVLAVVIAAWLARDAWRDRPLQPFALVAVVTVLLVASQGDFGVSPEAAARVLMCVVPLYLGVTALKREPVASGVVAGMAGLATIGQVLFTSGRWFT